MYFLSFIDDNTLIYALSGTYLTALIIFMLLQNYYGKEMSKRLNAGYLFLAVGMLCIGLRDVIPQLFSVVAANLMITWGSYLVAAGYLHSADVVIKIRPFAIPMGVFTVIHVLFTYRKPNVNMRIVNYSAFMILTILIYCFYAIRQLFHAYRTAYLVILLSYVTYLAYHVMRLLNAASSQIFEGLFRDAPIFKGFLLISIVVEITRILVLMIHKINLHNKATEHH